VEVGKARREGLRVAERLYARARLALQAQDQALVVAPELAGELRQAFAERRDQGAGQELVAAEKKRAAVPAKPRKAVKARPAAKKAPAKAGKPARAGKPAKAGKKAAPKAKAKARKAGRAAKR